jgi:hypothetical protein
MKSFSGKERSPWVRVAIHATLGGAVGSAVIWIAWAPA